MTSSRRSCVYRSEVIYTPTTVLSAEIATQVPQTRGYITLELPAYLLTENSRTVQHDQSCGENENEYASQDREEYKKVQDYNHNTICFMEDLTTQQPPHQQNLHGREGNSACDAGRPTKSQKQVGEPTVTIASESNPLEGKQQPLQSGDDNNISTQDCELTTVTAICAQMKPVDSLERHMQWVNTNHNVLLSSDESDDEPRRSYPSLCVRRDSTDLLIEEAKEAYAKLSMSCFQSIENFAKLPDGSDEFSESIDTYSDSSRSSCSTFDISEQTEDSEPRYLVPKLYNRRDDLHMNTDKRVAPEGIDEQRIVTETRKSRFDNWQKPFPTERVPSFTQSND